MKRVYLMRHAATSPRPGRPSDGDHIGITSAGREAARTKAKWLKAHGAMRVISSPLARARETAKILAAELGVAVETDERAKEFVAADVGPPDFKIERDRARREREWAGERGESFNASVARLTSFLDALPEHACVVSHELLMQNLTLSLGAPAPTHIDPLTIFVLERGGGGWRIAKVVPGRSFWQKVARRLFGAA